MRGVKRKVCQRRFSFIPLISAQGNEESARGFLFLVPGADIGKREIGFPRFERGDGDLHFAGHANEFLPAPDWWNGG